MLTNLLFIVLPEPGTHSHWEIETRVTWGKFGESWPSRLQQHLSEYTSGFVLFSCFFSSFFFLEVLLANGVHVPAYKWRVKCVSRNSFIARGRMKDLVAIKTTHLHHGNIGISMGSTASGTGVANSGGEGRIIEALGASISILTA